MTENKLKVRGIPARSCNVDDTKMLSYAIDKNQYHTVKALLNVGVKPTGEDLLLAVTNAQIKIVGLLIDSGVDVKYKNSAALKIADYHGYKNIIKMLKEAGCDPIEEAG